MKEFLKSVVEYYCPLIKKEDGSFDGMGLKDYLFVFPNRRSGLFFNHYLAEAISSPVFAPEMITISELYPYFLESKDIRVLDRIELLFNLYEVYKEISKSEESFDSFIFWGEMLLNDFNDADKYLVDCRLLFSNVKDLKEIDDTFSSLDAEQIKIIRSFWTNFNPKSEGQSKDVFKQTWSILFELYTKFKQRLESQEEAYEGMVQRFIVEDLQKKKFENTFDDEKARLTKIFGKKVVFVGLTALSKVDFEILNHLQHFGLTEFWWDYVDETLRDKNSHASFFKSNTIDHFPNVIEVESLKGNLVNIKDRNIEVVEVPSSVGQAVHAASTLQKWAKENKDPFKTAVVLPDEKMLLPMLYSTPKEYEPFNVTMGYSLKATTIATFVENLSQLQINAKTEKNKLTFYHKNVLSLLSTNFVTKLSEGKALQLQNEIVTKNQYRVDSKIFKGNKLLEAIFKSCGNGKDCAAYLKKIFAILSEIAEQELAKKFQEEEEDSESLLGEEFEEERTQATFSEIEREFLFSYIKIFDTLEEKLEKFNSINISSQMFFSLLKKLSNSESVAFSGEPLSGLQVMGVLETRGLDFDNIIILSANEGTFPAKSVVNSFIPMNLRHAFGMPTQVHKDAVYAYHFYRLISRASNVVMIYDSRTEGMQSGEQSRYVNQLEYLFNVDVKYKTIQYNIRTSESGKITVKKDQVVMDKLKSFMEGGKRNLSASSLKHYINCPLQFYLENVEGLREEDEIEESINDKDFGTIVHETLQDIYDKVLGREISSEDLDRVIKDKPFIQRIIVDKFKSVMNVTDIKGYLHLVEDIILNYVIYVLEHDKKITPFTYIASEKKDNFVYEVNSVEGKDPFKVNIVAIYDRLDRLSDGTERIVDYKTGKTKLGQSSKLSVPEINQIFSESAKCSNEAFQVMLYCLLYDKENLSPNLYFIRDFMFDSETETTLKYLPGGNIPINNFSRYKDDFKRAFDKLLAEIFDENVDFVQSKDENSCRMCNLKNICKRN